MKPKSNGVLNFAMRLAIPVAQEQTDEEGACDDKDTVKDMHREVEQRGLNVHSKRECRRSKKQLSSQSQFAMTRIPCSVQQTALPMTGAPKLSVLLMQMKTKWTKVWKMFPLQRVQQNVRKNKRRFLSKASI